jgi:ribosome-binding ATPase YchF (GTP1/OBG family)
VKIGIVSISDIPVGMRAIKDERLDAVYTLSKSKKKTYCQVEIIPEATLLDADALLVRKDSLTDLILKDLEFVENRLTRVSDDSEKTVLGKLKTVLENEHCIFTSVLNAEEKRQLCGYGLLTNRPITLLVPQEQPDYNAALFKTLHEGGFINFLTTGEKESRSWLIKKGATAWEAAGVIHSDIQKGFIRAEIISYDDFIRSGGEVPAKQAGKLRLEQKEYIMQDADLANFRFNK